MKIKIRLKHLKIQKCLGKDVDISYPKEDDKCGESNLLWSRTFNFLHLSLFLLQKIEIVEKKYFIYTHVRRTLYYYHN